LLADAKFNTQTPAPSTETPIKTTPVKVENVQQNKTDALEEKNEKDKKDIERIETDQEKMVLDLFDGKYVE